MKKIESTDPMALVEEASKQLLNELRDEGISKIKAHMNKIRVLTSEIDKEEKALIKKRESLEKSIEIIEKLKTGDWTALSDNEQK